MKFFDDTSKRNEQIKTAAPPFFSVFLSLVYPFLSIFRVETVLLFVSIRSIINDIAQRLREQISLEF